MAFLLIAIGAVLMDTAVKGTSTALFSQIKQDTFPAQGTGYFTWAGSIAIIGAIGYVPSLKSLSNWFLALVIVVLVLKAGNPNNAGGGFFAEIFSFLKTPTNTASAAPTIQV